MSSEGGGSDETYEMVPEVSTPPFKAAPPEPTWKAAPEPIIQRLAARPFQVVEPDTGDTNVDGDDSQGTPPSNADTGDTDVDGDDSQVPSTEAMQLVASTKAMAVASPPVPKRMSSPPPGKEHRVAPSNTVWPKRLSPVPKAQLVASPTTTSGGGGLAATAVVLDPGGVGGAAVSGPPTQRGEKRPRPMWDLDWSQMARVDTRGCPVVWMVRGGRYLKYHNEHGWWTATAGQPSEQEINVYFPEDGDAPASSSGPASGPSGGPS